MALALLAAPSPTFANDEICEMLGDLAEKVMTMRQRDNPMSTVMTEVAGPVTDDAMNKVVRAMIIDAYKQPSWRTSENKLQAAAEFRNANEVRCFEAFAD